METPTYDPLDRKHLGMSVARALLETTALPIVMTESFPGAGIYAIYYVGDFPPYEAVAAQNKDGKFACPIYVGKAIPKGARKGLLGLGEDPGHALYKRIKGHSGSIKDADNLRIEDFYVRYLVVEDIWIPLGESLLIQRYQPIWNVLIDGFGNNPPGRGRTDQKRSLWDTLHPGRGWARKLPENPLLASHIRRMVEDFIAERRANSLPSA